MALAMAIASPVSAQQKSVAVTAIVEHPALDAVRDGVQDALKQAGYEPGKNLKWRIRARRAITAPPLRSPASSSATSPTPSSPSPRRRPRPSWRPPDVPVVYSAVTDPVAAQLVASMEPTGTNVTGVSDLLALDKQIDLIKKIVPNAKRVGMVYNPGEANSVVVVRSCRSCCPYGMSLVGAAAPRSVDVASAARSLIGKVDVIYTNTDNNVVSAYESLVKVGNDAKIPLVASDTDASSAAASPPWASTTATWACRPARSSCAS